MSKTQYVDRVEASKILKVSTRTLDRYVRKHKFKTRKDGRQVLIKRVDIDKLIEDQIGRLVDDEKMNNLLNQKEENLKEAQEAASNKLVIKDVKVKQIKEKSDRMAVEQEIYKELYQEVKNDLKEKQDRLEAATYRVGQLEAQAKHMVPMLDYNKKDRALQEAYAAIDQKVKQSGEVIQTMEEQLKTEKVAKWVYLSLVGLLLVAEPILFLLWAFK